MQTKLVWHLCHSFLSDFLPFMKSLLCNPIYMLFILISVLQFNAFVSMISFMPKYMEQHYGKSASEAIFLLGMFVLLCISSPLSSPWNAEQCDDESRKLLNWNVRIFLPLVLSAFCFQGNHERVGKGSRHRILFSFSLWVFLWASLATQKVKNLPTMLETQVESLGWKDPLEKKTATHSSILAWRILWTVEPGGLQSMRSQSWT